MGVFAARAFKAGNKILSYYGTLVDGYMKRLPLVEQSYGEGALGVKMKRFQTEGLQLQFQTFELNREGAEKEHIVHIVAAKFCVAAKINDPRAVEGDLSFGVNERQPHVTFVQMQTIRNARQMTDYDAVSVVAARTIILGQELLVDFGNRFSFEE